MYSRGPTHISERYEAFYTYFHSYLLYVTIFS
jgi:hypothetical protein